MRLLLFLGLEGEEEDCKQVKQPNCCFNYLLPVKIRCYISHQLSLYRYIQLK